MPCPVVTASIRAWSSLGGSVSVHACHHQVRVMAGVSQDRRARKAQRRQGCWDLWGMSDSLSLAPPRSTGPARWHPAVRVGRTTGPGEGEGEGNVFRRAARRGGRIQRPPERHGPDRARHQRGRPREDPHRNRRPEVLPVQRRRPRPARRRPQPRSTTARNHRTALPPGFAEHQ